MGYLLVRSQYLGHPNFPTPWPFLSLRGMVRCHRLYWLVVAMQKHQLAINCIGDNLHKQEIVGHHKQDYHPYKGTVANHKQEIRGGLQRGNEKLLLGSKPTQSLVPPICSANASAMAMASARSSQQEMQAAENPADATWIARKSPEKPWVAPSIGGFSARLTHQPRSMMVNGS